MIGYNVNIQMLCGKLYAWFLSLLLLVTLRSFLIGKGLQIKERLPPKYILE